MTTGEKIKLFRTLAGITQQELSDILGVSQRDIVFIEQNRLHLKPAQIDFLANIFFCNSQFLIKKDFAFNSFCGFILPQLKKDISRKEEIKRINHVLQLFPLLKNFFREQCFPEYKILKPNKEPLYIEYVFYSFKTYNGAYLCFQVKEDIRKEFETILKDFTLKDEKTFTFEETALLYPPHLYFNEESELFTRLSEFIKHFYPDVFDKFIGEFISHKNFYKDFTKTFKKIKIQQIVEIMMQNQITIEDLQDYLSISNNS